jgi:hypothetical protein
MSIIAGTLGVVHATPKAKVKTRSKTTAGATLLPFKPPQPEPLAVRVVNHQIGFQFATTILREWKPGDTTNCQLCRRCTARENSCLISFTQSSPLPQEQAVMFSDAGFVWKHEAQEAPAIALAIH